MQVEVQKYKIALHFILYVEIEQKNDKSEAALENISAFHEIGLCLYNI